MKPVVVGISGGSGSGKTTLARALLARLGEAADILYQDSYYIDQSHRFDEDGGAVNFDHPESLEFSLLVEHLQDLKRGQGVSVPHYDFATHKRISTRTPFGPRPFVIVDGTLLLDQVELRRVLDLKIFVATDESLRFRRRLERDVRERGRSEDGVRRQFYNQVKPMHDLFVEPSQQHADLVLSGERPVDDCLDEIAARLDSLR
jgi:uridine kinase